MMSLAFTTLPKLLYCFVFAHADKVYCSITVVLYPVSVYSIEQHLLVVAQDAFGDCHLYQM